MPEVNCIAYSRNGDMFVGDDHSIRGFHLNKSEELVKFFEFEVENVQCLCVDATTEDIYVTFATGEALVQRISVTCPVKIINEIQYESTPNLIQSNGQFVLIVLEKTAILYDCDNMKKVDSYNNHYLQSNRVALSPIGQIATSLLAMPKTVDEYKFFHINSNVCYYVSTPKEIGRVEINYNADKVALAAVDGTEVYLYSPKGEPLMTLFLGYNNEDIRNIHFAHDNDWVVVSSCASTIRLYKTELIDPVGNIIIEFWRSLFNSGKFRYPIATCELRESNSYASCFIKHMQDQYYTLITGQLSGSYAIYLVKEEGTLTRLSFGCFHAAQADNS